MLRIVAAVAAATASLASSAYADAVKLANGDTTHGEIVSWAVDHVVIDHPQLGTVRLSLDQLELDTGEPPSPGLFGTTFMRGWKRHIDFGLNGSRGNTDSNNLVAGLDFSYGDPFKRWKINGRYFFNEEDDDNENNARLDFRRDWLYPGSRWFLASLARFQFDEFESWRYRSTFALGPGYNVIARESLTLDFTLGPAVTREWEGSKDTQGEMLFGLDYDWQITEDVSLSLDNGLFFELTPDRGEFRNLSLARGQVRLTEEPALSVNVGLENEYNSDPEEDDDQNNDFKYFVSLGLDF